MKEIKTIKLLIAILSIGPAVFIYIKYKMLFYYIDSGIVILLLIAPMIQMRSDFNYLIKGGLKETIIVSEYGSETKAEDYIRDINGDKYYLYGSADGMWQYAIEDKKEKKISTIYYLPKSRIVISIYDEDQKVFSIINYILFYPVLAALIGLSIALYNAIKTNWFFKISRRVN